MDYNSIPFRNKDIDRITKKTKTVSVSPDGTRTVTKTKERKVGGSSKQEEASMSEKESQARYEKARARMEEGRRLERGLMSEAEKSFRESYDKKKKEYGLQ